MNIAKKLLALVLTLVTPIVGTVGLFIAIPIGMVWLLCTFFINLYRSIKYSLGVEP